MMMEIIGMTQDGSMTPLLMLSNGESVVDWISSIYTTDYSSIELLIVIAEVEKFQLIPELFKKELARLRCEHKKRKVEYPSAKPTSFWSKRAVEGNLNTLLQNGELIKFEKVVRTWRKRISYFTTHKVVKSGITFSDTIYYRVHCNCPEVKRPQDFTGGEVKIKIINNKNNVVDYKKVGAVICPTCGEEDALTKNFRTRIKFSANLLAGRMK